MARKAASVPRRRSGGMYTPRTHHGASSSVGVAWRRQTSMQHPRPQSHTSSIRQQGGTRMETPPCGPPRGPARQGELTTRARGNCPAHSAASSGVQCVS
eukprot:2381063-Alexandrium_andersonii.AAC.1